jgi:hypothetical protein
MQNIHIVTCRPISKQRPKYAHATIVFCVVRTMPTARQRVAKHIPAEANAQNNRFNARQRCGKQALSRIQAVFHGVCGKWMQESRILKLCSCGRTRMRTEGVQRS